MPLNVMALQVGEILYSTIGLQTIEVQGYAGGAWHNISADRAVVHQVRPMDLVVRFSDFMGLHVVRHRSFVGGWGVQEVIQAPPSIEQWLRPGSWVEDSTDAETCQIVGVN